MMLKRYLHIDLSQTDDRNALFLVVEIFWAAILSSATAFNGILVLRLGASNADIGLLNSIPALLAVAISIPFGRFLQARAQKKPWILWSLAINRTGYLLLALHEQGLSSCWMAGPMLARREIERMLEIPEGVELFALVPVGYAAGTPAPGPRKPLEDVVRVLE